MNEYKLMVDGDHKGAVVRHGKQWVWYKLPHGSTTFPRDCTAGDVAESVAHLCGKDDQYELIPVS